jgi:hypothetical protein
MHHLFLMMLIFGALGYGCSGHHHHNNDDWN